jgi:hypothetical protein
MARSHQVSCVVYPVLHGISVRLDVTQPCNLAFRVRNERGF